MKLAGRGRGAMLMLLKKILWWMLERFFGANRGCCQLHLVGSLALNFELFFFISFLSFKKEKKGKNRPRVQHKSCINAVQQKPQRVLLAVILSCIASMNSSKFSHLKVTGDLPSINSCLIVTNHVVAFNEGRGLPAV